MYYIGADLGTSGLKMILMDEKGEIKVSLTEKYPIDYPKPGWSEQNPEDWKNALFRGIKKLTENINAEEIKAIGIDGQMHGLVMLDSQDNVIRPAILWNDTRTFEEVDFLNNKIGREKIAEYTGNIAFAGFTAPKILWVKKNEPENFARMKHAMLPKDYLNYVLTGKLSTDMSDASGMLLLDVKKRSWSPEMLEICGINEAQLPELFESFEVTGCVKEDISSELGLSCNTKVIAGAGDNAAAAVGAGTVGSGKCNISVGTSGTVFVSSDTFREGNNNAVHNFAHSDGNYHFLGCMLSAASCYDWWMKILESRDFKKEQEHIDNLGENKIIFLPYLMGERSPHNDENAKGAFIGLNMTTTRNDMSLAVLEGVAFGLKDSLKVINEAGVDISFSTLCGGGAKSCLWRKVIANILNIEIGILNNEEGPALGSAILAAVGDGVYKDVETACREIVRISETIKPDKEAVEKYRALYELYKKAYPQLKSVNDALTELN